MQINELQEPPEEFKVFDGIIESVTKQRQSGSMTAERYHSQMAHIYSIKKCVDECRFHAAQVSENAGSLEQAETYIALARILVYEHKMDEAIAHYEKALAQDATHETALEELGWCHIELKHYNVAEQYFHKAIEVIDDYSQLWEGLGMSASYQEKYNEAITYFTKALELQQGTWYTAYYEYLIALSYSRLNDFYRALAHYTKCLDANPSHVHALNNIGTLYYEHEADIKTAIEYLQKAEVIAKEEANMQMCQQVYINLIRLYGMVKEYNLQALYNAKLLKELGLGAFADEDEDDE